MSITENQTKARKNNPQFRGHDLKDHPKFLEIDGYFGHKQFPDGSYMAHCSDKADLNNKDSANALVHFFRFMTASGAIIFDYRWHVRDQDPLEILIKELNEDSITLENFCANHKYEWRRYYNAAKENLPAGRKMSEGKIRFINNIDEN